ncbi:MAG TPA: hypothetical protein VNO33_00540 [Kofleriaceae bacterium]|nr:hypothetical protein [Kofleriaceae bacterium]
MTLEEFRSSLAEQEPPDGLSTAMRALWLDASGDWAGAHDLAGDISTSDGALIHAYLHRKEGDLDNARYWYRQAGRAPASGSLEEEWLALVREFLAAP